MLKVTASAPGKAVLIGEYAVLHGAPALVMAVDRRVRVMIRSCAPEASRLELPQLSSEPIAFAVEPDGRVQWHGEQAERAQLALSRHLISQALEQSGRSRLPDPGGLHIHIDSSELFLQDAHGPIKLGLGSSAAVTVALTAALQGFCSHPAPPAKPLLSDLLQSHRQQQGGRGSGLDLAAALEGGLLSFRLAEQGPELRAVDWPGQWPLMFVWTGQAASTPRFLQAYAHWRDRQPQAADDLWRALDHCSREAVESLESGALERFMTCINNYRGLMGKIGSCIQAPVLSPQHQRLAAAANEIGAAYKPCGAGGGDLGVFVAAERAQLEQLAPLVSALGFRELALQPSLTGLQLAMTENHSG